MPKVRVAPIRLNAYNIIMDAVDRGIIFGLNRAHKHTEHPTREQIESELENAIGCELCEVINFNDETEVPGDGEGTT